MKKRILTLSLLMSCCFILFLCSAKNSQAETYVYTTTEQNPDYNDSQAADNYSYVTISDKNYTFLIYPKGDYRIQKGYAVFKFAQTPGNELIVPDSVEYKRKIYPVLSFLMYADKPQILPYQTVTLPDCVEYVHLGGSWPNLKRMNLPRNMKELLITNDTAPKFQYVVPDNMEYYDLKNNALYRKKTPGKIMYALNIPEKYSIAEGTTVLGRDCFSVGTQSYIKEVTMPASLKETQSTIFWGCDKLEKVNMKKSKVKVLLYATFRDTKKLKSLSLPKTLETIGVEAFYGSGISHLSIPSKVNTVKTRAFRKCKKLKSITFEGTKYMPIFDKDSFLNARPGIKFYVRNKKMAKQLKKSLKKSKIKKANIYVGKKKKLVYKNING